TRRERPLCLSARRAELLAQRLILDQALGLVPVRQASDQDALLDQIGAAGRQSLAGDPLGTSELQSRFEFVCRLLLEKKIDRLVCLAGSRSTHCRADRRGTNRRSDVTRGGSDVLANGKTRSGAWPGRPHQLRGTKGKRKGARVWHVGGQQL